jgi:hypothetical protein
VGALVFGASAMVDVDYHPTVVYTEGGDKNEWADKWVCNGENAMHEKMRRYQASQQVRR